MIIDARSLQIVMICDIVFTVFTWEIHLTAVCFIGIDLSYAFITKPVISVPERKNGAFQSVNNPQMLFHLLETFQGSMYFFPNLRQLFS